MKLRGVRDGLLAVFLALGAAWIAEALGADAGIVLGVGTVAALVALLVLAGLTKRQERLQDDKQRSAEWRARFGADVEVRDEQVVLSLHLSNDRLLDGATCEVRCGERVWKLGAPMKLDARQGLHPFRGVWRFPAQPTVPEPGHYTASMFVRGSEYAAGIVEWER